MKLSSLSALAIVASLSALGTSFGRAGGNPEPPKLQELLATKGGKVVIFQPTQIKPNQTLVVTHTQCGRLAPPKAGFRRAVQFVVYSAEPDQMGGYPFLFNTVDFPESASGAAPGGGPHVKVFDAYTHDAGLPRQGIIAVLIGLLVPADNGAPRLSPLHPSDGFSLELHDGAGGVGLLLPAVQKVREAASR